MRSHGLPQRGSAARVSPGTGGRGTCFSDFPSTSALESLGAKDKCNLMLLSTAGQLTASQPGSRLPACCQPKPSTASTTQRAHSFSTKAARDCTPGSSSSEHTRALGPQVRLLPQALSFWGPHPSPTPHVTFAHNFCEPKVLPQSNGDKYYMPSTGPALRGQRGTRVSGTLPPPMAAWPGILVCGAQVLGTGSESWMQCPSWVPHGRGRGKGRSQSWGLGPRHPKTGKRELTELHSPADLTAPVPVGDCGDFHRQS